MPFCRILRSVYIFGAVTGITMLLAHVPARYWTGGIGMGIGMTTLAIIMSVIYVFFVRCEKGLAKPSKLSVALMTFFEPAICQIKRWIPMEKICWWKHPKEKL